MKSGGYMDGLDQELIKKEIGWMYGWIKLDYGTKKPYLTALHYQKHSQALVLK